MRVSIRAAIIASVVGISGVASYANATCMDRIRVGRSDNNLVIVESSRTVRSIEDSFFGFNLEWVEFQIGLWDAGSQKVRPGVIDALRAFPGAVYRFPGGTKANHLVWMDAIGPVANRPLHPYVSWRPPLRAEFGLDEYLAFVREVKGQAWYVANLYGGSTGVRSLSDLAADARSLAQYMKEQSASGYPTFLRWELGNELDRGSYKWTPSEIAKVATQVASSIRSIDGGARFVHLQQEYPAMANSGYSTQRFNRELRHSLSSLNPDLALHLYYDGVPENPPLSLFLGRLCDVVDDAQATGGTGNVWVTEHARVPDGFWSHPSNSKWPQTSNLAAAISVADLLISVAQIPEVRGAFVHSLVGSGSPWPMFHRFPNGQIESSATLLGMKVLRQTMEREVVSAKQFSIGPGFQGASYAVRSAVLMNSERSRLTLWSVNRSDREQVLVFRIPGLSADLRPVEGFRLSDRDLEAGNHEYIGRLKIESGLGGVFSAGSGAWRIVLPANSVNAILFR